jgi:hypothetical protein
MVGGGLEARWLEPLNQLSQRLGINGVGLSALKQCFGKIMRLAGVDDTDGETCPHQRDSQLQPVSSCGLKHDQRAGWRYSRGEQVFLQGGKAGGTLREW